MGTAPPTFNKLASQLDRPLAKAAAVSLAADSVGLRSMFTLRQGDYWQEWNTALRDMVVETQIKDGHMAGTWNPADTWEQRGGRLYATSMKLLLLEIY